MNLLLFCHSIPFSPRQSSLCPCCLAHEVFCAAAASPLPVPRRLLRSAQVLPAALFIRLVLGLFSGSFLPLAEDSIYSSCIK